jgi:hypothetical protein
VVLLVLVVVVRDEYGFVKGPGVHQPWMDWYDQGQYLRMTQAIRSWSLTRETFTYGWGYPILGVPFASLANPFYFVNIAIFLLWAMLTYRALASQFGRGVAACALGISVGWLSVGEYVLTIPWNSAVSILALASLLYYLWTRTHHGTSTALILGLVLGWTFAARYVDAVLLAPLAIPPVKRLLSGTASRRRKVLAVSGGALVASLLIGGTLYLQHQLFGSVWTTPYKFHYLPGQTSRSDQDISTYDLSRSPRNLYQVWIDHRGADPQQRMGRKAIGARLPLLYLAPVGVVLTFLFPFAQRGTLLLLLVVFAAWNLFYGSYHLAPHNLPYGAYRYVAGWFPLLTALSLHAVVAMARPGIRWLGGRR